MHGPLNVKNENLGTFYRCRWNEIATKALSSRETVSGF